MFCNVCTREVFAYRQLLSTIGTVLIRVCEFTTLGIFLVHAHIKLCLEHFVLRTYIVQKDNIQIISKHELLVIYLLGKFWAAKAKRSGFINIYIHLLP